MNFFFRSYKKMSCSERKKPTESDAQSEYLYNRDIVLKESLESTNRATRLVPEISGKKKLKDSNLAGIEPPDALQGSSIPNSSLEEGNHFRSSNGSNGLASAEDVDADNVVNYLLHEQDTMNKKKELLKTEHLLIASILILLIGICIGYIIKSKM